MTSETGTSMNLSGEWSGVYNYAGLRPPIHFSASLQDNGGWITGATEEIATLGEAMNRKISATLQGRRTGSTVIWLKLYDRVSAVYDAVRYEGEVSADVNEISGRWIVGSSWSGAFLMIRPRAIARALRLEATQSI